MMMKCFGMVFLLLMCASVMAQKTTEDVRVSSYLYADMTKVDDASGGLVIKFSTPSKTRKVIAYGWSARKLRKSRVQANPVLPRFSRQARGAYSSVSGFRITSCGKVQ